MTEIVTKQAQAQFARNITLQSLKRKSCGNNSLSGDTKKSRLEVNRLASIEAERHICFTKKYSKTFRNWKAWRKSKPLRVLINESWFSGLAVRTFQPFELPYKGQPLKITKFEKDFRSFHRLCENCGNHTSNDGQKCKHHPIYEDIKIDNDSILGKSLSTLNSKVQIDPHSVQSLTTNDSLINNLPVGGSSSLNRVLDRSFPPNRRSTIVKVTKQASPFLATTAELLAPSGEWRVIRMRIDTQSSRSFVTTGFIAEHNMNAYVTTTTSSLTNNAHSPSSTVVSNKVLYVKLRSECQNIDFMAYVVENRNESEFIAGMDWILFRKPDLIKPSIFT